MAHLKETVLIAGGTGLIGNKLSNLLRSMGCQVRVLTRSPKNDQEYYWNPDIGEIDLASMEGVTVLINLSGAGIADKRWSVQRKKELIASRVGSNRFLFEQREYMPKLRQFICASGINAYGFDGNQTHIEADPYGKDFLSQLVRQWEESADLFADIVPVAKIRTAVVLSTGGGALKKMAAPVKLGFGAAIGRGSQWFPWIHEEDLTAIYAHVIENHLKGAFNAVGGCCTNEEFTNQLAKTLQKTLRLPNVPGFLLRAALGEMSSMLLQGVRASNSKIKDSGFSFRFSDVSEALSDLLRSQ